jgi:dTDP-4-dehydrorhamnose reductase
MATATWVIGAGGLVGGALTDAHRRAGRPVAGFAHADLDVSSSDALHRLRRDQPTTVFFAAARPWVEGCERDPDGTRAINVDAPVAFAKALDGWGGRLIAFSTEYVFDGTLERPYREDDPPRPLNHYGRQKRDLESALGDRHLVLRTSGVFGPEAAQKSFPWQLTRATADAPLVVPDDQLITPTWAPTLADAALRAAAEDLRGVWHVAGDGAMPRHVFAERLARACGLPADCFVTRPTAAMGLSAERPRRAALSVERARGAGLPLLSPDDAIARFAALVADR